MEPQMDLNTRLAIVGVFAIANLAIAVLWWTFKFREDWLLPFLFTTQGAIGTFMVLDWRVELFLVVALAIGIFTGLRSLHSVQRKNSI